MQVCGETTITMNYSVNFIVNLFVHSVLFMKSHEKCFIFDAGTSVYISENAEQYK